MDRGPLCSYDFEGLGRAAQAHHSPCGRRRAERLRSTSTVTSSGTTPSDIYQMDVVLSGGFVQNLKVAAMAEAENKIYPPHLDSCMGMAAALHMAGAVSNCPFIEYCYDPPYWPYEVRDMMLTEPLGGG